MANYTTRDIEALAGEIGEQIYIDVAKWHLYLADAHLHLTVAQKVYPLLADDALNERELVQILQDIPVKLGGGKLELPVLDLIPDKCLQNLLALLLEYQQNI